MFYLHTPAGRAHPFPGSSSPGWQALEGLEIPQVQRKRNLVSLAPLLALDRYGLYTHTHTRTHLCFSASRSKPRPLAPRFISQASRQCTASGLEREQRAVTQEEVWALRREASGEKHRTEGEKRDQRSGVAAAGADEMGTLGSRRSEGAPRVQSGQIWPGV